MDVKGEATENMDAKSLTENIVTALLTGSGAAATTMLGGWRDIKGKIKALEDKVGEDEDMRTGAPRTGLFLTVYQIREQVRATRTMLDGWAEDPPPWMLRIARGRPTSVTGLGELLAIEERMNESLGAVRNRQAKIEAAIQDNSDLVSREEYERDSRARADELNKLQRQMAESNSLLRGVMAALGYIDSKDPRK
jgi:hypothetical protein